MKRPDSDCNPQFRDLCRLHGLSGTHQRYIIWMALQRISGHPSPEAIYGEVRKEIPSISLATVYKNLKTFVQHGLLREVSLHHGSARIETRQEPHHHLVCVRCRSITDLAETDLEPVRLKNNTAPDGFRVHRYSIEIQGLCRGCSEDGDALARP